MRATPAAGSSPATIPTSAVSTRSAGEGSPAESTEKARPRRRPTAQHRDQDRQVRALAVPQRRPAPGRPRVTLVHRPSTWTRRQQCLAQGTRGAARQRGVHPGLPPCGAAPADDPSRCVALPVPLPAREAAAQWLSQQGVKAAQRWLAYAGGAPLRAMEHAAQGKAALAPVDDREALEPLAEALQKTALDHALLAFGRRRNTRLRAGRWRVKRHAPGSPSRGRWAKTGCCAGTRSIRGCFPPRCSRRCLANASGLCGSGAASG